MESSKKILDIDLAWLAGIIEGEGWVSLILYKNRQAKGHHTPNFTTNIGMVNCDKAITNKVKFLFDMLGITYRIQHRKAYIGSDGRPRKEKIEISVISHKNIRPLAEAILPFMVGEKKERLNKLLEFLDIRKAKPKTGPNSKYGAEEFEIYKALYSYKGKSRSKILAEFSQNPIIADYLDQQIDIPTSLCN